MRRYSVFHAIVLSFFSRELYRDIGRNWRGIGFLYLLFILALTWAFDIAKAHVGFRAFARDEFPQFAQKIPPITVRNGKASSPVTQPYFVSDPQTGRTLFILDTTGEITSWNQPHSGMLLTETQLHIRNERETRIAELSEFPDFSVDAAKIQGWIDTMSDWFPVVSYPLMMFLSVLWGLFVMVVYALIGLAIAQGFKAQLTFPALMRTAAVARTPMLIVGTVLFLAGVNVPFWLGICFVVTVAYMILAVSASAGTMPAAPACWIPQQGMMPPQQSSPSGMPPAKMPPPDPTHNRPL